MGIGRKAYYKQKQKKNNKDAIILLKDGDDTFWSYDDDAEIISREIGRNHYGGGNIHLTREDVHKAFKLISLSDNAYKAVTWE